MAGKQIKVFKIVNGYRKASIVTVIETFKVTFLGTPTTIKYDINGRTYGYNEIVDLETGEYTYRAYSPDTNYIDETGTFQVSGGDTYLAVDLKTQLRSVRFIAEDTSGNRITDADVLLDSKIIGKTNAQGELVYPVAIGNHTIGATKPLYVNPSQSFVVPAGETELTKVLIFSPNANLTKGFAFISSTPQGATAKVNGENVGITPVNVELQEGYYTVEISKNGYNSYSSNFTISRGINTTVNATLTAAATTGTVTFTSNVDGVVVYMNGSAQGTAPFTLSRSGGVYDYTAKKAGYTDINAKVIVTNGQNTSIVLNMVVAPVVPPTYPAAGTVLETYCSGFDKYERRANGTGGSYSVLVEKNALYCGAPQNVQVKITTNQKAYITVYDPAGAKVFAGETTDNLGTWAITPLTLSVGKSYRITASHIKVSQWGVVPQSYGPVDTTYVVPATSVNNVYLQMPLIPKHNRVIKYYFEFTEWSYSAAGSTNGTGGLITDPSSGSITASIRLLGDITGWGDGYGNSKGKMWYEIVDGDSGVVLSTSVKYTVDANNAWITDTFRIPAGSTEIFIQDASVTRTWQRVSGSVSTDATWTGATTFSWRAEAYQHFTWKESGTLKVQINLPFSYVKA